MNIALNFKPFTKDGEKNKCTQMDFTMWKY